MDKKTELEEFMGDLANNRNVDPLSQDQEDPFSHLDTKEEVEEEVKEEKPLPFNKDPKIQKYLDKREKEIEDRMLEKFGKREVSRETQPVENTKMDEVLTRIIGNDTPEKVQGIRDMKELLMGLKGEARIEALQELDSRQNLESQADRAAEEELENAFESIEENFDVDITSNNSLAKKTRQEFVSFVEKIAPKDRNGDIVDYPDMVQAFETFNTIRKSTATPSRAKELASRSIVRSAETNSEPVLKRGGTPFSNSDKFIESLSK